VYHRNGDVDISQVQYSPVLGVFSEVRGIAHPNEQQEKEMELGIPHPGWFEPGAWAYYRSLGDYPNKKLDCDHFYKFWTRKHFAPIGTFYGGVKDPYVIHYWGGTRAWDELKHPIEDPFVKECADPWKEREHKIWLETVSEEDRKIMPEIYEEMGI
jgi:hypothetical protein